MQQVCSNVVNGLKGGFINRAFKIRVQGEITQKMTDSIARGLQKSWPYRPTALLVTINSSGGSIIQAKAIADILKLYSTRCNVPVVTFAEDQCLNSANLILTSGTKCYASAFSMIGDMGYTWNSIWLDRFAKKYDVKQQYIYAPENKVKSNKFEPIKPEFEKWLQNYLYECEHELKVAVTNNRAEQFLKNGLDKQAIEQKVFKVGTTDPQEYVKVGLLDGLRNLDQEIKERYASAKIKEINPPAKRMGQHFKNSIALLQ